MEKHKSEIIALIGKAKYDESAEILKRIMTQEDNRGVFTTSEGDVDRREQELKDT
jgi:hypothetical protein